METIWLYFTSDKFAHLAVFGLVMLLIITAADLLDLYNRGSVQNKRGKKAATDDAASARIP